MVSKVTDDSISIKWLANNYKQLQLVTKGATVSRAISDKPKHFELVNFTGAKQWTIAPAKERIKLLSSGEENEKCIAILEPILEGTNDKEQQDFAMLTATVENMVNPRFQSVMGNIVVDTDFDKTQSYVYKIEVYGHVPAYIWVDASKNTSYSSIPEFELSADRKRTVVAEWNSNAISEESFGFYVEHSMDDKTIGSFINELPYVPFKSEFEKKNKKASVVHNPVPGHFHFYRVHGLDPFGHPSLVSEWDSIYVPLLIKPSIQIDTIIANNTSRQIQVSASDFEPITTIDSWALLRSKNKDSNYELIQSRPYSDSIETFVVEGKSSGDHFYYKIQAINKDDTVTSLPYYFFTLDQIPPVPPTALNGSVDSSGIVKLNWTASIDDDIRGYKVYRGNAKNEEFIERTTSLSTDLWFSDTLALNNLTSEVYYFVKSIDLNFNVSSESDTLLLLKPDTIPPMAAAIKGIRIVDTSIVISWANSESKDLLKTLLIRHKGNKIDTIPLEKEQAVYTDFEVIPGHQYNYELITIDRSKNKSHSLVASQYYEIGYRKALSGFKAEVDSEQDHVVLSWDAPNDKVYFYQLFRAKNDGSLKLYKTLESTNTEFTDKQLSIGTKYSYSIKYINQDGIHSLPSTTQIIY